MNLLLDTPILLAVLDERTGSPPVAVRKLVESGTGSFHVSVASFWELAIKHRLGKLELSGSLDVLPALVSAAGIAILNVTAPHVLHAVSPEPATRDPFDRLLLAQCDVEGLMLVTLDGALAGHRLAAR